MSGIARNVKIEPGSDEFESGKFPVSRDPGLRNLDMASRVQALADLCALSEQDVATLAASGALARGAVEGMVENAVGTFELPLGVALNLVVNGRDYIVPMATEEASVIAAASFGAKIVRGAGGFVAEADEGLMIAQVQVVGCPDVDRARAALAEAHREILDRANGFHPHLVRRGGGAKDIEVRAIGGDGDGDAELVVHLLVDTCDAMGANVVNGMAEGVAPLIEYLTRGTVRLRIVSNLADRRLARARCAIPVDELESFGRSGLSIAEGIVGASRLAERDPYRAATHNKGIMNGVDAVAIATGNDWRAIEAGAHAYAARSGQYRPLSTWRVEGGRLVGAIELPLAVGTIGGPARVHPLVQLGLRIVGAPGARELARVIAAVGLAQNLAALRVLGSVGIQRGHMALHARSVAVAAGARGESIERVAERMAGEGRIRIEAAADILDCLERDGEGIRQGALCVLRAEDAAGLPRHASSQFQFRVPIRWKSPIAQNPYAADAQREVLDWFTALGCTALEIERARKFDAAGYVGIPFPNLGREMTVRIGKYLSMWLLWDDVQVENLENRWRIEATHVFGGRPPQGMTRFDHGWWELFRDFATRRSNGWIQELCDAMAAWNDAAHREALMMRDWRTRGALPDFAVQLEIRIATIGMYATVYLLEDAYGVELPRTFHADPDVRRIKRLANKIVGLGNDVFSFGKDLAEKQINLISTLMHEKGIEGDEALGLVVRMHDDALVEYDRHAESVVSRCENRGLVERWLLDVRYASLGFSVWESKAPRYTAHKVVANGAVIEPDFSFI